jgi:membrane protein YqaA with SNARE-associated domain
MSRETTWLARTHARLEQWANAGWSNSVVFGWGLLQGGIVPGLADVFFVPLALARPGHAYRYALLATAGTLTGSVVLYGAGAQALLWLEGPASRLLSLTPASLEAYRTTLSNYGGWAIFASTMSPLSTKLTSIASGAAGVPFADFLLALTAGRLTRTLGLAWLVRHGGAETLTRITRHIPLPAPVRRASSSPSPTEPS